MGANTSKRVQAMPRRSQARENAAPLTREDSSWLPGVQEPQPILPSEQNTAIARVIDRADHDHHADPYRRPEEQRTLGFSEQPRKSTSGLGAKGHDGDDGRGGGQDRLTLHWGTRLTEVHVHDKRLAERYNLDGGELLAKGQFGFTISVKCRKADQSYVLRVHELADSKDLHKVCEELEVQARLSHPNICKVYEWYEDHERCEVSVVLEHLSGCSLEVQMHLRDLDETEVAAIFKKLCSAVLHIHNGRIIHGAIRPSNIIYESSSLGAEPKLTDFGVAAQLVSPNPRDGKMGTAKYAAPEMWSGIGAVTDGGAIDMWALGVTAFVLLSGKVPFRGRTMNELRNNIEKATPTFASGRWLENSRESADFCKDLLSQTPSERMSAKLAKDHPFIAKHIEASRRNTETARELFGRNIHVAPARAGVASQAVDLEALHEKSMMKLTKQKTRGDLTEKSSSLHLSERSGGGALQEKSTMRKLLTKQTTRLDLSEKGKSMSPNLAESSRNVGSRRRGQAAESPSGKDGLPTPVFLPSPAFRRKDEILSELSQREISAKRVRM